MGGGTPSFITLTADVPPLISIVTSDLADANTYPIDLIITEDFSGLTDTDNFVVTVEVAVACITSIVSSSTIADQVYYIGDALIPISVPSYVITDPSCPVDLLYDVKQAGGAALPAAITLDQSTVGSEVINIYETDVNAGATYTVEVKVIDQTDLVESDVISFDVFIRLRATDLVLDTPMADHTYKVNDPADNLVASMYSAVAANADVQTVYSLGGSTPAFVTIAGDPYDTPTIQVVTTSGADTGVYTIDVIYTDEFSTI